jgi:pyruvoyl-dependent arginine decarboxylase (PvlArgDC)
MNPEQFAHLQKKVVMKNINTGEIINTFNGVKEASRFTKVNSGSISAVCKGRKKTAGGYIWEYFNAEND